jgi:surfeit locus 1 family protein
MKILRTMLGKRWIIASVVVILGAAVCTRLGIWQLDRLKQRRAFNARVEAQVEAPELDLNNAALDGDGANSLYDMEYRKIKVVGSYDFAHQITLKNQYFGNEWGAHLITPLQLKGSQEVILVDRGWIPAEDFESGDWRKFDEPGTITVEGIIRRPQTKAELGLRRDPTPAPGAGPEKSWFFINIAQISHQTPYNLLPVYIQQAPDSSWKSLPYRTQPTMELTEGPHMGYAIQWFTFAGIMLFGFPFYVSRSEAKHVKRDESNNETKISVSRA